MDLLSRIAGWLGENEATISAVVGIAVLAGIVMAGVRSLVRRRAGTSQEKAPPVSPEAASADSSPAELDPLTVPGFEGRPAIAVLPFDNLSGDPEQEYFADGIAEDLITRLSAWRNFPVIARNSSFTYKGKPVDVKQVSRELGARYVVEGSVRRSESRIRVAAQLIDATTGHHIWAETYDRELRDILELQDEITQAVVMSMHPKLERVEQERLAHRDPQSFDAWDCMMRGWWHWHQFTREDNRTGRRFFERAIKLDPHSSDAFVGLAYTHYNDVLHSWSDSIPDSTDGVASAARRSVELDPSNPSAQLSLAYSCRLAGMRDEMIAAARRAVELNPSYSQAYAILVGALGPAGHTEEALTRLEIGMRLSPRDPLMWWFYQGAALTYFGARRYTDAVEWGKRTVQAYPKIAANWRILASSCAQLGRLEEARSAFEEALRLQPGHSLAGTKAALAGADPEFTSRYLEGLRKAGWKE